MSLVDTHCHLDFQQYDHDRDSVLRGAWKVGVTRILNPGIDISTSQAAVQLAESDNRIFAAVGVHPNSSSSWDSWAEEALVLLAGNKQVVAVGEIGLDYYRDRAPKEHQKAIFRRQLKIASQMDLPVVIHTRNASVEDRSCIADLIEILSTWKSAREFPGVVHSYSGNLDEAAQLISMGFFLGITGPVTYPNATELRTVVATVPLTNLLIETDGPFLSPQPRRGKRNEPAFVRFVAEKIAEVRSLPLDEVVEQVRLNAALLFKW